jgi:hypothetical protein
MTGVIVLSRQSAAGWKDSTVLEYSILAGSTVTSAKSLVAETAKEVWNGFSLVFIVAM